MRKLRSMRDQACSRVESFSKRLEGGFEKFIVWKVEVIKMGKNKRAEKKLKRGIIEIRRNLSDTT